MSFRVRSKRTQRGQAVVEFTMLLPFLLFFAMGTFDLGSWVADTSTLHADVQAGLRAGQRAANQDIGLAIRQGGVSTIPNTSKAWGNEAAGASQADCSSASSACGDAQGCGQTSLFWTTHAIGEPDPIACFAVTHCTLTGTFAPTCPLSNSWQTRPSLGSGDKDLLVVVVTFRFTPITPMVKSAVGSQVFASYQLESNVSY